MMRIRNTVAPGASKRVDAMLRDLRRSEADRAAAGKAFAKPLRGIAGKKKSDDQHGTPKHIWPWI
jgi:hypothetical protein